MPERSPKGAARLRAFEECCRAAGFALTVQRRAILEAVAQRNDHPTAEQIYEALKARVPEVSRATVYRVLELLVQLGAIGRAHHLGPATRFDSNIGHHHHLVCVRCNRVMDFEDARLDDLPMPDRSQINFQTMDYTIQFTGLCADCQDAENPALP